jgi:hypothetical protein
MTLVTKCCSRARTGSARKCGPKIRSPVSVEMNVPLSFPASFQPELGALTARITGSLPESYLIPGKRVQVPASIGTHLLARANLGVTHFAKLTEP